MANTAAEPTTSAVFLKLDFIEIALSFCLAYVLINTVTKFVTSGRVPWCNG